jgi:hypothetical protein
VWGTGPVAATVWGVATPNRPAAAMAEIRRRFTRNLLSVAVSYTT